VLRRLSGEERASRPGVYIVPGHGLLHAKRSEHISSSLCTSRLPRLGGLVQNDSVYGLNKCYVG
jgi:hypothetical protein